MIFLALTSLGLAAFITSLAIAWWLAVSGNQPLDLPGARRSHTLPTPRGGGLGPAIAIVAFGIGPFLLVEPKPISLLLLAFVLVGAVGWRDDHRGVARRWRLLAHAGGALLMVCALWPELPGIAADSATLLRLAIGLGFALLIIASINLHNFMDGIDGLLALQAAFIASFLCFLPGVALDQTLLVPALVTAVACLGFLPLNFPRARIFMGDVGSTVIGLTVALLLLIAVRHRHLEPASALVLPILFVIDSGLTLATRLARTRRWYHGHRAHTYQWLVRAGLAHRTVSLSFLLLNLTLVAPLVLMIENNPLQQWWFAGFAYAAAALAWFATRALVARRMRARR